MGGGEGGGGRCSLVGHPYPASTRCLPGKLTRQTQAALPRPSRIAYPASSPKPPSPTRARLPGKSTPTRSTATPLPSRSTPVQSQVLRELTRQQHAYPASAAEGKRPCAHSRRSLPRGLYTASVNAACWPRRAHRKTTALRAQVPF